MKRSIYCCTLMMLGSHCPAIVYYSNQNNTNPASYFNLTTDLQPPPVLFDDVLVPFDRQQGAASIPITKIEADMFAKTSGTYVIRAWYAAATLENGLPQIVLPPTSLGAYTLAMNANERKSLVIGDGSNVVLNAPQKVITVVATGRTYGLFYFGFSFVNSVNDIGWVTADGPDDNFNSFYAYIGAGAAQNGYRGLGGGTRSSFNLKLTGNPVPEPSCVLSLMGGMALLVSRKRMRCGTAGGRGPMKSKTGQLGKDY